MIRNGPTYLAALAFAAPAAGQDASLGDARGEFSDYVAASDVGAGYAQLINMFIDPAISLSRLELDDPGGGKFDIAKLPFHWELPVAGRPWRVALRGLLSHSSYEERPEVFAGEYLDARWSADSGMLGAGLVFPLDDRWSVLTLAGAGVTHLENDTDFQGPTIESVQPILDGIITNWKTNAAIYDLRLGLDYRNQPELSRGVSVKTRYTFAHSDSFGESRDFPAFEENTHVVSILGEYRHPWGFSVGEFPVFGIVGAGATAFLGDNRDALGFTHFYQAGYSLALDFSKHGYWIKSLSIGYQWNQGADVSGQSILLDWEIR